MIVKGDVLIAHDDCESLFLTKGKEYEVILIGKRWTFAILNDRGSQCRFTMYPDSDGDSYKNFFIKKVFV